MKIKIKHSFWKKEGQELKDGMSKMLDFLFIVIIMNLAGQFFNWGFVNYINVIFATYILIIKISYTNYKQEEKK